MSGLVPSELADLWYLKFGHEWQVKQDLPKDWKDITTPLMQNDLMSYAAMNSPDRGGIVEIVKLKEK